MKKPMMMMALFAAVAAFGGVIDNAWIKGTTDKDPLTYKEGEEMAFTLVVQDLEGELPADTYFLKWRRTGDDGETKQGKVPLTTEPFVYKTSIAKPGFVRFYAEVVNKKGHVVKTEPKFKGDMKTPEGRIAANKFEKRPKKVFFDGGAAVKPETLEGVPEPADFDAFWKGQKAKLAAVPFKDGVKLVEKPAAMGGIKIYAVEIPCAGPRPVTGHISIPTTPGKYPAQLSVDGYNGAIKTWEKAPVHGPKDRISMHINAHGYELGRDKEYYAEFAKSIQCGGKSYALSAEDHPNPTGCYFEGMVFRVLRALEYLKSLPQWNGKDLVVRGGSQGGLQSAWAAGLDSQVTEAYPSIPWCCDMGGATKFGRNNRQWGVEYTPAMDYYDPVNMAKRVPKTCFVEVPRAGLGDYTCPPSGVAVYYNNLKCPKKITWVQGSQHGYVPPVVYPGRDFVRESK